ncbi:MAG: ERF family protein [Candidatus Omnitrophica bacterium]|nr:ERF family protein [Candidatus Omnitrophota bacterium]
MENTKTADKPKKSKTLYQKLFELQNKCLTFAKSADNPFFHSKYTPLDEILKTLNPALKEIGLLIYHRTRKSKVITRIMNPDNPAEFIASSFPIKEDLEPQKIGSAITYAKRYNIGQLLNIITDEDDDANSSSEENTKKAEAPKDYSGLTKDKKFCDVCGEQGVINPKTGKSFCPKWKEHSEKGERWDLVDENTKKFLSDMPPSDHPEPAGKKVKHY